MVALRSQGNGRWEGPHAAEVAIIRQMSRQVSSSSAGDYQGEEQAGVALLSWRLSSR